MRKNKMRAAEIAAIFAKHNFYFNGLTPYEFRTTLEDLGPTYVKIGQIMSSRTDILPETYCEELKKLRSEVAPIESDVVKEIIEQETGRKINEIYREFSDTPLGAASMGQAHLGILPDGRKVVTKVQRPNIEETMLEDLKLLKSLAGFSQAGIDPDEPQETSPIDLGAVLDELERVTIEELDYRIEAANTREFHELCIEDDSILSTPEIIDELSTKHILTMTYIEGDTLSNPESIHKYRKDAKSLADILFNNYLHQIFDAGLFHADPHQGNIMIDDEKVYWIDFGMLGRISQENMQSLRKMILSILQKNAEDLADAVLALGIAPPKFDRNAFTEDVHTMLKSSGSMMQFRDFDLAAVTDALQEIMGEYHLSLPHEYTMLVRSMITMEGVVEELDPDIDLVSGIMKKLLTGGNSGQKLAEMAALLFPDGKFTENLPLSILKLLISSGTQVANVPGSIVKLVNHAADGKLKVKLELTGYEGLVTSMSALIMNIVLALFSCILFIGGCILALGDIQPKVSGLPAVSMFSFIVAIALGMFSVYRFTKKK